MQRRLFISLAPLLFLASTAGASEDAKAPKQDVGQYVDMQPLAMPIVVKGELINYVFVYVRLNLTSRANVAQLRDKEPYFRDALVRAAHRTPFVVAGNYEKVDEARLTATMMREAVAIAGPGQIRSAVVTSQAPQKRVAPSRPAAPAHS
ncbi:MAG: hypothetical protein JWQ29_185 [Phenylobacterium sp.]|jgi:hypothetical protein|nr:hypothetical protein [Phenylobacterium sp.]